MSRYARQMILPEVGAEGQARLAAARVLVVGAGGLGATLLPALVGAGVGHITVIDHDSVEIHNLHRQTLFTMDDIGDAKAEAAARRLRALNPDVTVVPLVQRFDPANAAALVKASDVCIDAADSFAATYTLSDVCKPSRVAMVSASVLGLSGYAGGFCGDGPSYRALFPSPDGQRGTCASAGVLGPAVAMLGACQAQMALACLLRLSPSPIGRLVTFELGSFRFSGFSFGGAPEPETAFQFVAPTQLLAQDRVFDLRGADEMPELPPFAERLDSANLATLEPQAGRTILCCRSGLRAWRAADELREAGHGDLALMACG